ncbi:MAG: YceD family protein [Sphingobium sp.]
MSAAPEFSRPVAIDRIGGDTRPQSIAADEAERLALARRFRLRAIDRLEASYTLMPDAEAWLATGTLSASVVQACAATGQDVPESVETPFSIRFVAEAAVSEEEVELSEDDCDVMTVEDGRIDMGEAAAQTLALNLDPYPRAPDADAFLKEMGVKQEGEAGALAGLKDLLAKKGD